MGKGGFEMKSDRCSKQLYHTVPIHIRAIKQSLTSSFNSRNFKFPNSLKCFEHETKSIARLGLYVTTRKKVGLGHKKMSTWSGTTARWVSRLSSGSPPTERTIPVYYVGNLNYFSRQLLFFLFWLYAPANCTDCIYRTK